ncbi:MAG: hypothetical protein LUD17_09225 [Bacteroidales bacterium]|nr:hypothetical protein [Bacteroidales bacterium]
MKILAQLNSQGYPIFGEVGAFDEKKHLVSGQSSMKLKRLKLGEKFGNGEGGILWIGRKLVTLHTFTPHNQYHGDDDNNRYPTQKIYLTLINEQDLSTCAGSVASVGCG